MNMIKRLLLVFILILNIFSLTACGGNQNSQSNTSQVSTASKEAPKIEEFKEGSIIKSESAEVKINKISLSYDVLPDKMDGFYTHYPAKKGNVYIDIDLDVKNLQKQNLPCDKIMKAEADYNNGYKYKDMPIVKDSSTGFTYANITSIKPLETRGMKFLIECPQEVESSKNPLIVTITLDGKSYQCKIR